MLPLLIGLVLIIAGLGTVAWLMWNESKQLAKQEPQNTAKDEPEPITPSTLLKKLGLEETNATAPTTATQKKSLLSFLPSFSFPLLSKWLPKKTREEGPIIPTLIPSKLPDEFNQVLTQAGSSPSTGTASLRLDQGASTLQSSKGLGAESDWNLKYEELQKERDTLKEKLERLDALFKEKGETYDKTDKALQMEVKNRKEFNKVKDLLEKELKDNKDKYRELEVVLGSAQTESNSYFKRVNQLEEKIKSLEKIILEKEKEAKEFQGQIQGRQKLIAELEEKIKVQEKIVEEKSQKINEIVRHIKEGETAGRGLKETRPQAAEQSPSPVTSVTVPSTEPEKPTEVISKPNPEPAQTESVAKHPKLEPPTAPAQLEPTQPPAETARGETSQDSSKKSDSDRGNIILQAIEKGQTKTPKPLAENPEPETNAVTVTTPQESITAEPTSPKDTPEKVRPSPQPTTETNQAPGLKLAPDILSIGPKEPEKKDETPEQPATKKTENAKNKPAPESQVNPDTPGMGNTNP